MIFGVPLLLISLQSVPMERSHTMTASPGLCWFISAWWDVYSVWPFSPNNVFFAGEAGRVRNYDGNYWSYMDANTSDSIRGLWGSEPSQLYALTPYEVLSYNGTTWRKEFTRKGLRYIQ